MSFLETASGTAIVRFYEYVSTGYMYLALCCGILSVCYQLYDNRTSTRRTKQLFLISTILSTTMISARVAFVTIPTKGISIFYANSIFFEFWGRYITVTEILKPFVPLSKRLTNRRVNILHLIVSVTHFSCFSGIFGYFTVFQSPGDDHIMARWFRIGTFLNNVICTMYTLSILFWAAYAIQKHVSSSRSTVSNYYLKKRNVMVLLFVNILLTISSMINLLVCLTLNPQGTVNERMLYQYFIQISLSSAVLFTVVLPVLFHCIVALKFEQKSSVVVVMAQESRLEWKPKDNSNGTGNAVHTPSQVIL